MSTRLSLSLAALLLAFGLAAPNDAAAQKYGGTLTLGMYADLHTPDLHRTVGNPTAQMGVLVAESLVDYDEKCDIAPGLASSWDITDGGKAYTFHLRKGVMFHNGKELTAEDVKKNYAHFLDKKTKSPRRGNFNSIKGMEVVDKYTIKFTLAKPDNGFLVKFRPLVAFITHSDSFESKPPKPIGTGAFEFVEWQPKQHVKLKRFKNYWKKDAKGNQLPFVDEVVMRPILDDTVRYTSLRGRRPGLGLDGSVRAGAADQDESAQGRHSFVQTRRALVLPEPQPEQGSPQGHPRTPSHRIRHRQAGADGRHHLGYRYSRGAALLSRLHLAFQGRPGPLQGGEPGQGPRVAEGGGPRKGPGPGDHRA